MSRSAQVRILQSKRPRVQREDQRDAWSLRSLPIRLDKQFRHPPTSLLLSQPVAYRGALRRMREFLSRILRAYSRTLNKHKYATQIATGGLLWFSGDILCQGLVHLAGRPTARQSGKPAEEGESDGRGRGGFSIDWQRTGRMAMYGVCLSAPTYAFWYSFLERHSQRVFAAQPPGTSLSVPTWLRSLSNRVAWHPLQNFLVANDSAARLRTWKIIGYKLGMDTFVFDPLYLSLFFTATGIMEGKQIREVGMKLRHDLAPTWLIDIAVWTPIQTANFRWVPVLYQALVVQSCNIGWNAYLSFVQHNQSSAPP